LPKIYPSHPIDFVFGHFYNAHCFILFSNEVMTSTLAFLEV